MSRKVIKEIVFLSLKDYPDNVYKTILCHLLADSEHHRHSPALETAARSVRYFAHISSRGIAMDALRRYLEKAGSAMTLETVNWVSSLSLVAEVSPQIAASIVKELEDQRCNYLKLIASENFSSLSVQAAMANLLTDKYAEGYPYHRFYAGCDNVDAVESLAVEKAKELFGAEHAYVQPHSGADANLCAYWAILNTRVQMPSLQEMGVSNVSDMSREDWNRIRSACHNQRLLGLDY